MVSVSWSALGWNPVPGRESGPGPDAGPVAFVVIAPWCEDCREIAPRLRHWVMQLTRESQATGSPLVHLVGEFASVGEITAFAEEFGLTWPILTGTSEKTEGAREQARFRDLREAWGDPRKWGVPLWIEGRLARGVLAVQSLRWPG
jgi:hypothetical protein